MKNVIGLIVILLLLIACETDRHKTAAVAKDLLFVKTAKIRKRTVRRTLPLSGLTTPFQSYNIVPKQSGRIEKIYCEVGDRVTKGQLLVELDKENLEIQKKKAQAQLIMAQANYENAEANLARTTRLHEEKAMSNVQLENAQNMHKNTQASYDLAKATLEEVEQAISDASLHAPADGYIAARLFEIGDNINPMMGNLAVLVLHRIDKLKVRVNVSKDAIGSIRVKQQVLLPDYDREASVFSVGVSADPASGSFPVEILLDNANGQLRPGVIVSLAIIVAEQKDVVAVPRQAVYEQEFVFVVQEGVLDKRNITIDFPGDAYSAVTRGVKAGETVVIDNLYALKDKMRVRVE